MTDSPPRRDSLECLSDAFLIQAAEGWLGKAERERAWAHAVGCDACRRALEAAVQDSDAPSLHADPPPPAPTAWTPPPAFDEFQLGPEIGRGAMGVVYRARNVSVGREVALKFIASAQPGSRLEAFFRNEARLLATLNHANIVTLYSVGEVDGHPYIETELIQGQRLVDLPRPLPWDRVLELGLGLAQGLEAAHRQRVLHRDIKPSNAIATPGGGVKLLDFGLAERVDPDAGPGARGTAGTLLYMAPECADGAPATERSDLYSLGAVLFQLLANRVPREGARLGPGFNPNLAAVIEQCIRADPAERFASAELLVKALKAIQPIQPLDANPYRGLSPFEAEHQSLFFGRGADVRRILERFAARPVVLVAAESGVGKSSLCRAGILPRAGAGQVLADRVLTAVTVVPGRWPLGALAAALAPVLADREEAVFTQLADEPVRLAQRLRDGLPDRGGLLLFVDQLEELVTLSDAGERDVFAGALAELARPSPAIRVLLAVRGDFFTRVAGLPGLGDEVERALYLLRPMSAEGLREAIVAPARACGVSFESEALVQHLVDATARGTGGLPLLSFALAELWERHDRAGARITQASLDALGGVAGMLARHADGVVAPLSEPQTREARRLLLRLITAERTRIERRADELNADSPDAQAALSALVQGRLVQARAEGGHVLYQLTHDSLIHAWPRLVGWLNDDVGQSAVRQRLGVAAAEWTRLERAPEALWPRRQLDEARALDPSTLTEGERGFLQTSRARVTRRRWLRRLAATLAVTAIGATYGSFRVQQWSEERAFVTGRQEAARAELESAFQLALGACGERRAALAWFDPPPADRPQALPEGVKTRRDAGERSWRVALAAHDRAEAAYRDVERALEAALERQYGREESRELLDTAAYGRLELEECFHPQGAESPAVRAVAERISSPPWRARVDAPTELDLFPTPAGTRVDLARYGDVDGRLLPEPVRSPTGKWAWKLAAGSYQLRLSAPGRAAVALPVLLARGRNQRIHVVLPASVPDGMVYVPPGCFLEGSDDEALRSEQFESSPLHQVCMERGYLIGRTEVTFGDWLQYLDALPPGAEARHLLEALRSGTAGGLTLRWQPVSGWTLSFFRSGKRIFTAWEGEDFVYRARTRNARGDWRRLPLSGVSALDLAGYFAWLDRSGRLPGARLCTEAEWERAARGADARGYPGGDQLLTDDANFDVTYGRQPDAYGPDMAGAHPASTSPFGLVDMAGNALEMTTSLDPEQGQIFLRGGGWYYPRQATFIANRTAGDPTLRDPLIGARLCAPAPTPAE